MLLKRFHDAAIEIMKLERRVDPFGPALDAILREPLAALVQALINLRRRNEGLRITEEKLLPSVEAFLDSIIADMAAYMRQYYASGEFQGAGNTKTHGIVRGEFIVRDDVPLEWRRGALAEPRTLRAWVRFAGPGPASPPDIEEVGVLSIATKLMGVPGPKLLDNERFTQDFMGYHRLGQGAPRLGIAVRLPAQELPESLGVLAELTDDEVTAVLAEVAHVGRVGGRQQLAPRSSSRPMSGRSVYFAYSFG